MEKSGPSLTGALDKAEDNAKTIAEAGPPGVLLVTMIILMVMAVIVLGILLLGSRG